MYKDETEIALNDDILYEAEFDEVLLEPEKGINNSTTVERVYKSEGDKHRWRTYYKYVFKIVEGGDESFWSTSFEEPNDENCDANGYIDKTPEDLIKLKRVYPVTVPTTIYVTNPNSIDSKNL